MGYIYGAERRSFWRRSMPSTRRPTGNGETAMWAQLITMRLKPGKDEGLPALLEQIRSLEQPGTGLIRTSAMRDQNDPSRVLVLVAFESEEKARERENDPARQEGMEAARATMAELFDGPPEFVDLTVVTEWSGR
jgi:quinol monooxygenase YgiN